MNICKCPPGYCADRQGAPNASITCREKQPPKAVITRNKYFEFVGAAVADFLGTGAELEKDGEQNIQAWNDEFMLCLYEVTKDGRKS